MSLAKVRVVHVTTAHSPTDNRIFRKECICLAEAGLDVHLVAVADHDRTVDGVRIVALPAADSRWRRMLLGPVKAWQALQRLQPDVVHVHDPELIPLALLWRWRHSGRTVYDAHEDLPKQIMGKPYLPQSLRPTVAAGARILEKAADRFLDGVVAATPSIARNYPRSAAVLVQNFPWLRDFPTIEGAPTGRNVAYVGGIAESRGALEMMSAVASSRAEAHLVLAGPVASATLLAQMQTFSKTTSYRGQLPVEQIPGLLSDARMGLAVLHPLPNYLEAQATKLFEYMAAERPFIASDFPAWRALTEKYSCGLFVDPLDVDALTSAIDLLLTDTDLAHDMGQRGRAALVAHFCFEAEASKLIDLTNRLGQRRSQRPPAQVSRGALLRTRVQDRLSSLRRTLSCLHPARWRRLAT